MTWEILVTDADPKNNILEICFSFPTNYTFEKEICDGLEEYKNYYEQPITWNIPFVATFDGSMFGQLSKIANAEYCLKHSVHLMLLFAWYYWRLRYCYGAVWRYFPLDFFKSSICIFFFKNDFYVAVL